jgi:hypothetical protein
MTLKHWVVGAAGAVAVAIGIGPSCPARRCAGQPESLRRGEYGCTRCRVGAPPSLTSQSGSASAERFLDRNRHLAVVKDVAKRPRARMQRGVSSLILRPIAGCTSATLRRPGACCLQGPWRSGRERGIQRRRHPCRDGVLRQDRARLGFPLDLGGRVDRCRDRPAPAMPGGAGAAQPVPGGGTRVVLRARQGTLPAAALRLRAHRHRRGV